MSTAPAHRPAFAAAAVALVLSAAPAAASVAIEPRDIFSPFDGAQVTIEWNEPDLSLTGHLRWANPSDPHVSLSDTNVFDLSVVRPGDRFILPELFAEGQSLVLGYAPAPNATTVFTHDDPWALPDLVVTQTSPTEFLVFAPGRYPGPDGGLTEHATVIVRFALIPAPGSALCVVGLAGFAPRRAGRGRRVR